LALSFTIFLQLKQTYTHAKKPYILCTTTIIADTVKNITHDTVEIITLMGPGVDPHLYKPVESDILKINFAKIIFYNGLHLEAKMADIFQQLQQTQTTIAITQDIPQELLLSVNDYNQIFDPHVWFDIHLWIYAVNTIKQTLCKKFPEHANLYEKNSKNYINQLKQLAETTQCIMNTIPVEKRILITGHDAFSYFGRLYNCKVIGLQGISTESSPGAYDIAKIINLICEKKIPALFIESSIPIKNIIAIQEGVTAQKYTVNLGGQLYSDALGDSNSSGNSYINMIQHNIKTIAKALQ